MAEPTTPDRRRRRSNPAAQRRTARGGEGIAGTRRVGQVSLLLPPPRPPATPLERCLDGLQQDWQRQGNLAALWQRWPQLAGPQLAPHCRPLRLQGSRLTVGAAPGPWLQALQYHRHQLLGALRAAGFALRDLRIEQHHQGPLATPGVEEEALVWAVHPSRADVHGMASCPRCSCPAPAGEMARWGQCSFCRRRQLAAEAAAPWPGP
jgi:predicted nucleic acid-binding Zn ribbon protein